MNEYEVSITKQVEETVKVRVIANSQKEAKQIAKTMADNHEIDFERFDNVFSMDYIVGQITLVE